MNDKNKLISFHIIERENNTNLVTWTYPTITDETRHILLSRCFVLSSRTAFFCLRNNNLWIYVQQVADTNYGIAIIVITKNCDYSTYKSFSNVLMGKYQKTKNPVDLVKLYLTANRTGSCSVQDNGNLIACNFSQQQKETKVLDIVEKFGAEAILLYTGLLLKRRILVYFEDIQGLQNAMLAISNLCQRRNLNEFLIPLIDNLSEIKGYSFFLAGTTNNLVKNARNSFDLYVDLHNFNISIVEQSRTIFTLTKAQKTIAKYYLEAIENNITEQEFLQNIKEKTEELVNSIKELPNETNLALQQLKAKNFSKTVENFLFNLWVAENIVIV